MFDFEKNLTVIENSVTSLDHDLYQLLLADCIKSIQSGHKIVISGLGKNIPVCEKFVGSMNSVGLDAAFLHTSGAFHGDLGIVKDGDIVILLSKSGKTSESLVLADKLKLRNITTWALTFETEPNLSKKVDRAIILSLEQEGGPWNTMPMNSVIVYLFILQGLIIDLVNSFGVTLSEFKSNHPGGGIGEKLAQYKA